MPNHQAQQNKNHITYDQQSNDQQIEQYNCTLLQLLSHNGQKTLQHIGRILSTLSIKHHRLFYSETLAASTETNADSPLINTYISRTTVALLEMQQVYTVHRVISYCGAIQFYRAPRPLLRTAELFAFSQKFCIMHDAYYCGL
ncbi:conserved hypothetical protein, partial [Trichinella spiralis]|uniref:hypothetical protein n=1 Tax=Trichinella spiralis TaxID=6334 RepID=UPI0001EFE0DB